MNNLGRFSPFEAAEALSDGEGIYICKEFVSREDCRELIEVTSKYEPDKYGTVRGLLDKTDILKNIIMNESILQTCRLLMGTAVRLGSVDVKVTSPSDYRLSEPYKLRPHVDYPYSDVIGDNEGCSSSYYNIPFAVKVFLPLTDLCELSGGTIYIPGSHKWHRDPARYPGEFERILEKGEAEQLTVPAGSLAMWSGPLWHADPDNRSTVPRFLTHICITSHLIQQPQLVEMVYSREFFAACDEEFASIIGLGDHGELLMNGIR